MKWMIVVVSILIGCGGDNPPIIQKPKSQCREVSVDKGSLSIPLWVDPKQMLEDDFVFLSLNSYWKSAGVSVVKAESPEMARVGLIYVSGGCKWPVEVGRIQMGYWSNLDSIIVDYNCFEKPDYKRKFPAAVSHALGNLMGIEAVPDYCGGNLMQRGILQMTLEPPSALSEGDLHAYWNRDSFSSKPVRKEVCRDIPEAGKFQPAEFRTVRFFADATFQNTGVEGILNNYFALFGRSFQLTANETEAEFKMTSWISSKSADCSPLAIAIAGKREIKVRAECLVDSVESYWAETILVHETAHLFGMNHIPNWCSSALMNPYVTALPHFTSMDVVEWKNRDKSESILDTHRVLRMKYQGVDVDFLPLSRLRLERLLRTG